MGKYFIIKADDLKYNPLSRSWFKFLTLVNELEIPVTLGLIGKFLECKKTGTYTEKFLNIVANHEIFAHGYSHNIREYKDFTVAEQKKSILHTLEMAEKILKKSICTFGAPGNNISESTSEALNLTPITIWLFGRNWKGINLNQRNFEFEYSNINTNNFKNKYLRHFRLKQSLFLNKRVPGNCGFQELAHRYENVRSKSLIMGQIHPATWSFNDLKELEKFLKLVSDMGEHQFITPRKYVEKIAQEG